MVLLYLAFYRKKPDAEFDRQKSVGSSRLCAAGEHFWECRTLVKECST